MEAAEDSVCAQAGCQGVVQGACSYPGELWGLIGLLPILHALYVRGKGGCLVFQWVDDLFIFSEPTGSQELIQEMLTFLRVETMGICVGLLEQKFCVIVSLKQSLSVKHERSLTCLRNLA